MRRFVPNVDVGAINNLTVAGVGGGFANGNDIPVHLQFAIKFMC